MDNQVPLEDPLDNQVPFHNVHESFEGLSEDAIKILIEAEEARLDCRFPLMNFEMVPGAYAETLDDAEVPDRLERRFPLMNLEMVPGACAEASDDAEVPDRLEYRFPLMNLEMVPGAYAEALDDAKVPDRSQRSHSSPPLSRNSRYKNLQRSQSLSPSRKCEKLHHSRRSRSQDMYVAHHRDFQGRSFACHPFH